MRKIIFLIYTVLFLGLSTTAQEIFSAVYEIKTDTVLYNPMPAKNWQMLEDKDGTLKFEGVIATPVTNLFHFNTSNTNHFDYNVTTYWFRYIIKNVMDHPVSISFKPTSEQSDFYFVESDGKTVHQSNGRLTPLSKLDGLKWFDFGSVIQHTLDPGERVTIYNRVSNSYTYFLSPADISIEFSPTEKFAQQHNQDTESIYSGSIYNSIFFGVFAMAALFNFFFFLIVHERVYLYFSLYITTLGIGRMTNEFYFIFFREAPLAAVYFDEYIWLLAPFLLTNFIRTLLQLKTYKPWWNRLLIVINYLYLILFFFFVFSKGHVWDILYVIVHSARILLTAGTVISFFLVFNKLRGQNKVLLLAIVPAFTIWGVTSIIYILYWNFDFFNSNSFITSIVDEWWTYIETICLGWLSIFYSWFLLHRFSALRKQIAQNFLEREIERNQLIEQQKIVLEKTVSERTSELKQSLVELKSTQVQLIQSEKMASLGELTAGIAHEIQNPLNFVNNFSEVNTELIEEMQQEMDKGNMDDARAISKDIKDNEVKINHHGKRADAIVKGMLQHSQSSSGVKEPTNINKLADEYLILAYHGLRAKDQSFNATLKTDFDESIGKIKVIPQDIGRALLNLYNNAFYAVNAKKKNAGPGYEPIINVTTKKQDDKIIIRVIDNGDGVPQKIIDKIFQPFFTTKPTGQGTGLGLSLSYDIVKAHGGELKLETSAAGMEGLEKEGSTFVILLPEN